MDKSILTNSEVLKILNEDPLAEAERITGKDYKDDISTSNLGLCMATAHAREKEALMDSLGDSSFACSFEKYRDIITDLDFYLILNLVFENQEDLSEFQAFYYHAATGCLLVVESYHRATEYSGVNSARLYFDWVPTFKVKIHGFSGSFYKFDDNRYGHLGSVDAREGIKAQFNFMREHGTFQTPWHKQPWLWFVNYMATKERNFDHKAIANDAIARFPKEIQIAIGGFLK